MITNLSMSIYFLINFSKIYTFGESAIAGVCITTLISICNLGNNRWLNYKILDTFGFNLSVAFGLGFALALGLVLERIFAWVERG